MKLRAGPELESLLSLCRIIHDAGGRAFLVGGLVRDLALAESHGGSLPTARDFDLEVFGFSARALRQFLEDLGRVSLVGEAFAVYKFRGADGIEVDVSLPRRESKTGPGHGGFDVVGDPFMTVEEASRRRDFTVNALLWDPLSGEVLDPHRGLDDLRDGRLRAVDPRTFVEDPLRVLRAAQFAARFEFSIDPGTVALCRSIPLDDLPAERLWGEMEKLLMRSRRPSLGLQAALELGAVEKLFPELHALVGCPQEPGWHPEGDVWVHTLRAVDVAASLVGDLAMPRRLAVMLGTLCHDVGKPSTTQKVDGKIRSIGHEESGVAPALALLDRLNIHTVDGFDVRAQVGALVANHLKPGMFFQERNRITDAAFRRLARKCEPDLLYRVAKADALARGLPKPEAEGQEWFREKVRELGVAHAPPAPLLLGRHVLELGLAPGPKVGRIVDAVYELQLEGTVATLDEAVAAARRLLAECT